MACGLRSDGRRCHARLMPPQHQPGEDEWGYEDAGERWLPVHTVESVVSAASKRASELVQAWGFNAAPLTTGPPTAPRSSSRSSRYCPPMCPISTPRRTSMPPRRSEKILPVSQARVLGVRCAVYVVHGARSRRRRVMLEEGHVGSCWRRCFGCGVWTRCARVTSQRPDADAHRRV